MLGNGAQSGTFKPTLRPAAPSLAPQKQADTSKEAKFVKDKRAKTQLPAQAAKQDSFASASSIEGKSLDQVTLQIAELLGGGKVEEAEALMKQVTSIVDKKAATRKRYEAHELVQKKDSSVIGALSIAGDKESQDKVRMAAATEALPAATRKAGIEAMRVQAKKLGAPKRQPPANLKLEAVGSAASRTTATTQAIKMSKGRAFWDG